jgi:3-deoxy-D-manno-octulosonic-acid transferase
LIIVPRYPADAQVVEQHARQRGLSAVLKTAVDRGEQTAPGRRGVLIVDTVGELGVLYAVADIAFVGGSLFYRGSNKGGHNLMEPAILAVPVLFGPYNFSFKETVEDLLAADAGLLVRDTAELRAALVKLTLGSAERRELGQRAQQVVRIGQGATSRNYDLIVDLLAAQAQRLQAPGFNRKMPRAASDPDSPL